MTEGALPVSQSVSSACEILGFSPLYVANEGCFIAFVPQRYAQHVVQVLQKFPNGQHAIIIGQVGEKTTSPHVSMTNNLGSARYLYKLAGDQLPRIC